MIAVRQHKKWCELFLTIQHKPSTEQYFYNTFFFNFLPCPAGFVQLNGACTCDPLLNSKLLSITTCDINHQTILRPANTWLSAITINSSHQYQISPHCPLQYCLPHSSQLNISTPMSAMLLQLQLVSYYTIYNSRTCASPATLRSKPHSN